MATVTKQMNFDYYQTLLDAAMATNDQEERSLMVGNGMKELAEKEEVEAISRDIGGSRIIQKFIEIAPEDLECLEPLSEQFSKHWFALITDKYSSYVIEDYLKRLANSNPTKIASNEIWLNFFKTICKVTTFNLDECLPHARASHVIRGLISSLAAVKCFPKGIGDDAIRLLSPTISLKFRELLIELANSMVDSEEVSQTKLLSRLCNEYAAPVYCTLLKIAKYRFPEEFREEFCKTLAKCIHNERSDSEEVCQDPILSHVLNDLFFACPSESSLYEKLLKRYLRIGKDDEKERISAMLAHPIANYCIQSALKSTQSVEILEETFQSVILESMTLIFNESCLGVVTQLVKSCIRLLSSEKLRQFSEKLKKEFVRVLKCGENEKMVVPCLFFYLPLEDLPKNFVQSEEEAVKPNLPGCLLLEAIFTIPNLSSCYIESLLHNEDFLRAIACTAEGYHFISQLLSSKLVQSSDKVKIVDAFAPSNGSHLLLMATSHFGCLTYKAIWDQMIPQREKIAKYLSKFPEALRESKYGRFLFAALSLKLYSNNPARWALICGPKGNQNNSHGGKHQHQNSPNKRFYNNNNYNNNNGSNGNNYNGNYGARNSKFQKFQQ